MTYRDTVALLGLRLRACIIVATLFVITIMGFTWRPVCNEIGSGITRVFRLAKGQTVNVHAVFSQTLWRSRNTILVNYPSPKKHVLLAVRNLLEGAEGNIIRRHSKGRIRSEHECKTVILRKSAEIEPLIRVFISCIEVRLCHSVLGWSSPTILPTVIKPPANNTFSIWRWDSLPARSHTIYDGPLSSNVNFIGFVTNHVQEATEHHQDSSKYSRPSSSRVAAKYEFYPLFLFWHGYFFILFFTSGIAALGFILSLWRTIELIEKSQSPLIALVAALMSASVFCAATWGAFIVSH